MNEAANESWEGKAEEGAVPQRLDLKEALPSATKSVLGATPLELLFGQGASLGVLEAHKFRRFLRIEYTWCCNLQIVLINGHENFIACQKKTFSNSKL